LISGGQHYIGGAMQQTDTNSRWTITPSVFASGVFHMVLLLLLVFGLPQWEMQAEHPEAIQVQLVQPEETAPEEEPMPAEEEVEEPPAPEEPEIAEQPEEEQPPVPEEPEVAEQPEEEQPPVPEESEVAEQQENNLRVLDPVFQYGEEDSGPDVSALSDELDGSEVAEEPTPEETEEDTETEAQQAETASEEPQEVSEVEAQVAETTSEEPLENAEAAAQVEETLQALAAETTSAEPQEDAVAEARVREALAALAPELVPLPVEKPGLQPAPARVQTTRSSAANGRLAATRDARGLTRGERAGVLCASELDRRLRNSPYPPQDVPRYVLEEGNVLQVRRGRYLARNAKWYNLKFRCEIDDGARRVVDFNMEVGREILW